MDTYPTASSIDNVALRFRYPTAGEPSMMEVRRQTGAPVPSFQTVRFDRDTISYRERVRRDRHPIAGVRATIETAGELGRRMSATRTVGGGLLLGPVGAVLGAVAKKKTDDRQVFLLVEGPDFAWAVEVNLASGVGAKSANDRTVKKARTFAAAVTTAGKKAAVAV